MAAHDSSFNFKRNTDGSGNESSDAKSISAGQHIVVFVWNYDELPAAGSITYSKDGGAAVSAGAPVQVRSRSGNSDRAAAFIIRNPGAGSYVINSIGLDYLGLSAHVFNAKANFWVRGSSGAAGEGTGTTFTSGSVTPRFESSIAYGYWTHNTDGGGTSAMTVPGGWTLAVGPDTNPHKQEDYDGVSQPGGCAYQNITDTGDTKTPVIFAPTCANSVAYLSLLLIISEPDTEYVIAGGIDGRAFFGNDALGGRITAPVVFDFTAPETGWSSIALPAGQGVVIFQTRYNQTPSNAAEWSAAGSGNTVLFASNAQRAHNSAGSNDNSVNYFYFVTASACGSITYDASGLPAGDDGRYGQIVFHITERPDTVNGFYTATGATNTQTSTTTVNFPSFTMPTTLGWRMKGTATRNHADQLCPVTQSPTTPPTYLTHPHFDDIPQPTADYPSGFQNSVIASGACTSEVVSGGGTATGHTWTFTGPMPTTGSVGSVITAFNLQGGSVGGTLAAGAVGVTIAAPTAALVATRVLSAGPVGFDLIAPAAAILQVNVLAAGAAALQLVAPTAAISSTGPTVLSAGPNGITFVVPTAIIPGSAQFAEWLAEVATSRIILCELQPAEALVGWTVVGGQPNTYSVAWPSIVQAGVVPGGVYRRIDTVKQNDVELTQRASIALVNANLGSWFYDATTEILYVSTTTAGDPDTFAAIAAYFTLFLATQPVDFVGGQLYEPRLTGDLPTVQSAADDPFVPIKTLVEGTIHAVNAHAFFDVLADAYIWRNKNARLFLGGGDLPRESYAQIAACEIDYLAVGDDVVKLGIRSLASWLEQTLPLHTFTRDEYPRLAEGLDGSYKPLLYGAQRNIPGLCVDMYVLANPEFLPGVAGYQDVYLVADPGAQVITNVTGVRAINRSTGELRGVAVSQYTVNLAACTVTIITDAFRADEWELRIDATGETDGVGGYLSTFGEIVRDVLLTLGVPSADVDASSFAEADTRAPFPLGLWIREPVQAAEIVSLLQQSVIGGVFVGTDGRWRAYVLDASDDPEPIAALEDADISGWTPVERIDPIYPLVRCFYDSDPSSGESKLTTAEQAAARYLFETSDGLSVQTALIEASDAQIVAQRYRLLSTSPDHQFDVPLRGLALMTTNVYDRVLVTRQRAPGGSYVDKRMEILAVTKKLGPPGVQVRVGDIAGISDLIGRIRAVAPDGIPDYALASSVERELYAFVADDDGRVDPGDPSTTDHSVIW